MFGSATVSISLATVQHISSSPGPFEVCDFFSYLEFFTPEIRAHETEAECTGMDAPIIDRETKTDNQYHRERKKNKKFQEH
eukprot:1596374-Amphidinium_carterae.1